jgi:poly(3-hydroxyalkanoate) synthetase
MCAGLRLSAATLEAFGAIIIPESPRQAARPEPAWTTPHEIVLDLPILRLRQFGRGEGTPVIIVTPYALHGPVLADLAPGHSLVERLLGEGATRLFVIEWKSAVEPMRFLGIDDYLAHLLVVVDHVGEPSTLVGLCQGGWLSLMLAARFPEKVEKLVLAGAPADLDAAPSSMVTRARDTVPRSFKALVEAGDGLILGQAMLALWNGLDLEQSATADALQVEEPPPELIERFRAWHAWTMDLPGRYYLQVVEDLFRGNKLAKNEFVGLGRTLDLSAVRAPLYLIAAKADEVVPPAQVFAARQLVATPAADIKVAEATGNHLSLFMGARNLATVWRGAAHWLQRERRPARCKLGVP